MLYRASIGRFKKVIIYIVSAYKIAYDKRNRFPKLRKC
jgi:hypothetical protein